MLKILNWLSNAKAYFNISSRFSTTYFQQGGGFAPQAALKTAYACRLQESKSANYIVMYLYHIKTVILLDG